MADNRSTNPVPPQDLDAERALLGAVMLRSEVLNDLFEQINSESFYAEKHRLIWQAMVELFDRSDPIDLLTVGSRLAEKKDLETVGGRDYLAELTSVVPSAANVRAYADSVYRKWSLRKLINSATDITALAYAEEGDLDEILNQAEKKILQATNVPGSTSFISARETLSGAFERYEMLSSSEGALRGIPSGFTDLDNLLAGFQKSDLIILAARPSVGKTSFALDIARQTALSGIPVGIFSLEMGSQQLVDRMVSAQSKVDSWKLRTGKFSDEDFTAIRDAMSSLSEAPIYIDDMPGNNIVKMRSAARRLKSEKELGLIIVDYLQLMVPTQTRASDSMVQQVTEISRSLKNLARELDVPVLALSQLSRAVEQRGGKPRLSDLRDSGSIEQDADVVMFIHRERDEEQGGRMNEAEIMVEKHRNGPTGIVKLFFDAERTSFLNFADTEHGRYAGGYDDF